MAEDSSSNSQMKEIGGVLWALVVKETTDN
jgi:hypothetical protein